MTNAPERIWIEDEFGDGDEDQWTYGTWDVRNYRGYVVEYVRADLTLPAVQPDTRIKEYEEAYQYALHLAEALRENYPPNPDFQFLGDLVGLLTQIDNMVAGLSQPDPREAALRDIARQKKTDEMDTEYDVEYADFEGGYNAIIDVARVALRAVQPDLTDPVVVHANMLRGTIAKPTLDQIIHLYGVDALCRALVPAISREAALDEMTRLGQEFDAALKGESHEG